MSMIGIFTCTVLATPRSSLDYHHCTLDTSIDVLVCSVVTVSTLDTPVDSGLLCGNSVSTLNTSVDSSLLCSNSVSTMDTSVLVCSVVTLAYSS